MAKKGSVSGLKTGVTYSKNTGLGAVVKTSPVNGEGALADNSRVRKSNSGQPGTAGARHILTQPGVKQVIGESLPLAKNGVSSDTLGALGSQVHNVTKPQK